MPRVGLVTALRAWVEANPPPCVAAPAGDVDTAEALLPLARAWLSLILRGKDAPSESLVEGYADAAAERLVADEDDDVLCALLSALEVGFQVQQPIAAPCPPPPLRSSDWLLGEGPPPVPLLCVGFKLRECKLRECALLVSPPLVWQGQLGCRKRPRALRSLRLRLRCT